MFKQKISITINSKAERNKLYNEFETLMGSYCNTGQVQSPYETTFIVNDELVAYQTTIEKGSLSKMYNDEYVNLRIKNLEEWCNAKLKTEVIGKAVPFFKGVCKCKTREFFILFTHSFNETSPIDCGTCNRVIPFYKLNLIYDDRYSLLGWESNYKACDDLQLGCTVGEKWATKQMTEPASDLSKQGIDICKRIKEKTGTPTYYYLYNYRFITHEQDKRRQCPSCGSEWLLKEQLHNFYDFKCDKCRLLSSFTPNTR